jgi:site-specific recombinase XerD
MRDAVRRAGIGVKISPHSSRVAIATDLYEQDVPDDEVHTLLGYSDVWTMNSYKGNKLVSVN